ncbi:MAG: ABC transporter permease [Candidatus Cryosericum sp.]|jgi:ABC-2 type transport system permease protein
MMLRKVLTLAGLQLRLVTRDRSSFVWLLLVPIIFTTLVGAAFGGFGSSGPAPRVPIAFVDLDRSFASGIFEQALRAESSLDIQTPSEANGRQQVKDNKVPVLIVLPAGFGADIEDGTKVNIELVRSAGASSGYFLEQLIDNAAARVSTLAYAASVTADQLARWQTLDTAARLTEWRKAFQAASTSLATAPTVTTDYTVLARTQPQVQLPDNQTQSSTGFGVMFVMAGVLGTATALVSERLRNTLARLLTTPTSIMAFLGGKLMAMMTLGILQFALFILWGRFVLRVDWGRDPLPVLVMVVAYVFAATGLGILVGSMCKTMAQAGVIATFVTYGTSMIAGSWWPIEIAPPFMQQLARALPQYWAVNGLNKIIVRGLSFGSLGPNILVLALTGALCLVAGSVIFTRKARS